MTKNVSKLLFEKHVPNLVSEQKSNLKIGRDQEQYLKISLSTTTYQKPKNKKQNKK